MLGVMDIYALRRKVLVEGQSQRRVAREMGLARDTVRRYLATPVPERQQRRRSSPVLEQVRPRLEQLLDEWSLRTTGKQRISGRRLHRQLREEGYEVRLTLVLAELREWRSRRAEVYVPLVHRPAESAQADFFAVTLELNGERRRIRKLLVRLRYSDRDFVRLYERQAQLAFLDCIHRSETDPVIVEEQRFRQSRFVPVMMAQGCFGVQGRRWRGRSCSR